MFREIFYFVAKLFDGGFFKWLAGIIAAIVSYLFPTEAIQKLAISAGLVILLDTATGLLANLTEGAKISSGKFARLFSKLIGYLSILALGAIVHYSLPMLDTSPYYPGYAGFAGALLTFIILAESISILENLVTLKIKLPFGLTERLKAVFESKIKEIDYNPDEMKK